MKKILLALVMVICLFNTSYAVPLPIGPVTFHMTNWENRVTATGQTLAGIFRLDQLLDSGSNVIWNSGDGGEELTGVFSGLTLTTINDFFPVGESIGDQYLFSGGNIKVYSDSVNFNPTNSATAADGSLWLDLDFVTGGDFFNPPYTLSSTTVGGGNDPEGFLSIAGNGKGLLDVVGGSAAAAFNTNTYTRYDLSGAKADVSLNSIFYIRNIPGHPLINSPKDGWDVWSKDPIGANVVPEPASMLLLGMGVLGLASNGLRRNKVA